MFVLTPPMTSAIDMNSEPYLRSPEPLSIATSISLQHTVHRWDIQLFLAANGNKIINAMKSILFLILAKQNF